MTWNNSRCKYRLTDESLESSPAERRLGVLVESRPNMSQQCALASKKVKHYFWVHQIPLSQSVKRGDSPTIFIIGVVSSVIVCALLGTTT